MLCPSTANITSPKCFFVAQTISISKGSIIHTVGGQDNLSNFPNILHANLGKKIKINWLQKTGENITRVVSLPPFVQPGKKIRVASCFNTYPPIRCFLSTCSIYTESA